MLHKLKLNLSCPRSIDLSRIQIKLITVEFSKFVSEVFSFMNIQTTKETFWKVIENLPIKLNFKQRCRLLNG